DARADVGEVGQLEEALDRAVLAVRAVEHDDDDVETAELGGEPARGLGAREAPRGGALAGLGAVGERLLDGARGIVQGQRHARVGRERAQRVAAHDPATVARDADRHDDVALLLERRDHRRGGGQGDLVLAGAASEHDADAQLSQATLPSAYPRDAEMSARAMRLKKPTV